LRLLAFTLAGTLLMAGVGRFRFLEVLGWAVFFASLYWTSIAKPSRNRCRL
jgi:hypothetical protein